MTDKCPHGWMILSDHQTKGCPHCRLAVIATEMADTAAWWEKRSDWWQTSTAALEAEVATLREVVAKLAKTKDGVAVVSGMDRVFFDDLSTTDFVFVAGHWVWHVRQTLKVSDCYSSALAQTGGK